MEQENLATELLHMIKKSAQRWFIAFIVMVVVEALTIVGFLWYITLPSDEYEIEQTIEDVDNSSATQMIGGDYNGENETEGNSQEESNSYKKEKKVNE